MAHKLPLGDMIGDDPSAQLGTDEWDQQVAESVRAQLAAQQAEWERQFGRQPAPPASSTPSVVSTQPQADLWILLGVGLAIWALTRLK